MDELNQKPGQVTKITEGVKKKKEVKDKLKPADVYQTLCDAIQRRPWSKLPRFPERYGVLELELGARLPILISDDQTVQIVKPQALINSVATYCARQLLGRPDFALTMRQAKEAAEFFLGTVDPISASSVANVRWKDEEGLTYRRLPWTRQRGSAPTWEGLLSRMSNAEAFIDWVGSLFFEDSSLQNYVWIYGTGGDGKGSINRFLARVFDKAYRTKQPPAGGKYTDKFWTYGLLGARLVSFPDCNNHTFVSGGLFKSLTGGDPVDVEAKGQMAFTATINAKYLILSQEKPSISSEKADLRRLIYCQLGTCPELDPKFEEKLWEEGGYFLTAAIERYQHHYPEHGPIKTSMEEVEGLVSTLEEPFEVAFESWFALEPEAYVTPVYMQSVLVSEWPGHGQRYRHLEFLKWLERTHTVRKVRLRFGQQRAWGYVGIKLLKIPPISTSGLGNCLDH